MLLNAISSFPSPLDLIGKRGSGTIIGGEGQIRTYLEMVVCKRGVSETPSGGVHFRRVDFGLPKPCKYEHP